jgi:hypothetical protein
VIDASSRSDLHRLAAEVRADVVLYAHSYLAAAALEAVDLPAVVDFPNLESVRLASFAQAGSGRNALSARLEAAKARRWEPRVASVARLALPVSRDDADILTLWGADVMVIPNAVSARVPVSRSPDQGYVLFLASAGYAPNDRAADRLLRQIWPRIIRQEPGARLRIVGRETQRLYAWAAQFTNVEVVGEVADVTPSIDGAAVVLVPVDSGGGSQLKVVHALARGRVVVASPYSARSAPTTAASGCVVARDDDEFSALTVGLLRDVARRHTLEESLGSTPMPTWRDAARPLTEALPVLGRRS